MIHQYKVELQERMKNHEREREREREREKTLFRERIIKKIIENNVRRKKSIKNKYIYILINTKLSKSCYVM